MSFKRAFAQSNNSTHTRPRRLLSPSPGQPAPAASSAPDTGHRFQLYKLRALVDAAATVAQAARAAPVDASAFEKRSLCAKAAPAYLACRIGIGSRIPLVQANAPASSAAPWTATGDDAAALQGARVLEYAVGLGAGGEDGPRLPDALFTELLGFFEIPP